jgi:hypothetical protein
MVVTQITATTLTPIRPVKIDLMASRNALDPDDRGARSPILIVLPITDGSLPSVVVQNR